MKRSRLARHAARLAALSLLAACDDGLPPLQAWIVVEVPPGSGLDLATAKVAPESEVGFKSITGPKIILSMPMNTSSDLTVRFRGACPLVLTSAEIARGGTIRRKATPLVDAGGDRPDLGFDTPFEITLRPGCPEAERGRVEWRKNGAPLADVQAEANGFRLKARTAPLPAALGAAPPWGVVPLSPRTRAETELVAVLHEVSGATSEFTVRVAAAPRSRGLPDVAVGTRFYLGGEGWKVVTSPPGAHASIESRGGTTSLLPDRAGRWELVDGAGKPMRLVAEAYDATPLDCGRSDCHAAITTAAASNPMTSVLQRGVDGHLAAPFPGCALACHATGEPGLHDGGFTDLLAKLGWAPEDLVRSGWHELPPTLRRLGGVGCLACHGPGAIPEPEARHAVLRADVCATCHDAPPRYGHVEAWRGSRMARSDADPRTREGECARCHTTWGYLDAPARKPPEGAPAAGIACAACHAVHPTKGPAREAGRCEEALARTPALPPLLGSTASDGKSRVCLPCHTPSESDATPRASAGALWAGRGGLDPDTSAPLDGTRTTSECVTCHALGPAGLGRGASHGFRAERGPAASDPAIRQRALELWGKVSPAPKAADAKPEGPPHATPRRIDRATRRGRAEWNLSLIVEDPAADAHNAPYARALLEAAERALGGTGGKP